ncbi:MAG: Wzz/FepE/Etk N-terminal domain-containing protein [Anaerococcus sp.]|nr:Wzz/FepE/Etk N-terminal domain-containing protein [Anaerococcus sp.]
MEEREIDLLELFDIIKKNFFKIILVGLIFGLGAFLVSKFLIAPKYESSVSLIVNNNQPTENNEALQLNDVQLNQKLVGTYTEIIKTRGIASMVIDNLGLDIDYEDFVSMVSVSSKNDTEIFEVSVRDTIPQRAADIANETSKVFKDAIVEIMNVNNVQILDEAIVAEDPYSPSVVRNTGLGFILGIFISIFIILVRSLLDTRIKSADDITDTFDLPVIGILPDRER